MIVYCIGGTYLFRSEIAKENLYFLIYQSPITLRSNLVTQMRGQLGKDYAVHSCMGGIME